MVRRRLLLGFFHVKGPGVLVHPVFGTNLLRTWGDFSPKRAAAILKGLSRAGTYRIHPPNICLDLGFLTAMSRLRLRISSWLLRLYNAAYFLNKRVIECALVGITVGYASRPQPPQL